MDGLEQSVEKMQAEGVAEAAIDTFRHYHRRLSEGDLGALPESEIEPVDDLPDAEELPDDEAGAAEALDRAVVLKLNGGLGTGMGLEGPKSLLEVKEGRTFLDVIVEQVLSLRDRYDARLPLVLMNSFSTREDTLAALERHPGLASDVPLDFLQNKVPKLGVDDLAPVSWPDNPELEWAPPGHGDLYPALVGSGMLETLLENGYRYAFVSNSDNLGAVLEPRILAWFAREEIPFLMEAADRTPADRKGGHLAATPDGGLVLRESAQTPDEDEDSFQDVRRHRYFNTNSLWVDLQALSDTLGERGGVLPLPMIANRKTVDPSDKSSPPVIQVETAMGAAIGVFDGARALRVPRSRFAPVKTTNDLLSVRSDAYVLTEESHVSLAPERDSTPPDVDLDSDHFKLMPDFEARFPAGPPSLLRCDRLTVEGDVLFGRDVTVRGTAEVRQEGEEQLRIEDGAVLGGGGVSPVEVGSEFAGYRIEAIAGEGGMGRVYRATQIALERPVALKVIVPELADDAAFRTRFQRESRLAASIDHPNVIPVYQADTAEGRLFITMRWVQGNDLRKILEEERRLLPERAATITAQLASALDAAHRRGLVHRDVKPANVMVTRHDEEHVYLMDFGLTKRTGSESGVTRTGQFVGTPDYISPEQIRGEGADARADVYALGGLLYHVLTGAPPFPRDSDIARIYAHLEDDPPEASRQAGGIPAAVDEVIATAMEKEPEDRYASAAEFGRAARSALTGVTEAPLPSPPPPPPPTKESPLPPTQSGPGPTQAEPGPTQAEPGPTRAEPGSTQGDQPPTEIEAPPTRAEVPHTHADPPSLPTAEVEQPPPAAPATTHKAGARRPRRLALLGLLAVAVVAVIAVVLLMGGGSEPKVAATVPVEGGPDGIAVAGDEVWVTSAKAGTVTRLSASSNRPSGEPIKVGNNPDEVAVRDGVAWVTNTEDGTVNRIRGGDTRDFPVGTAPEGLSLSDRFVWVANGGDDTVSRLDRSTGERADGRDVIRVGDNPIGVFAGPDTVWVTNSFSGTVSRLDPSSGREKGRPTPVGKNVRNVVEGLGSAWVSSTDENTVTRLNPASGDVVGSPTRVGKRPKGMAVLDDQLWVVNEGDNTVTRLDKDGKVVGTPIRVGRTPVGIAAGAGSLWVTDNASDTVTRIDP